MKALSRTSKWNSKKYSQEIGETNWKGITPIVEASHKRIILETESTASQLVSYQNLDVQSGDKLLVKLSDNNYHEVTVDSVASGTPAATMTTDGAIVDSTYWNVTGELSNLHYASQLFSEDGLTLWSGANSSSLGVTQYSMSSPFDLTTLSPTGVSLSVPTMNPNDDGFFFSNDGRYIYISSAVYATSRYTLSKPFDISTAHNKSYFYPGTTYTTAFTAGAVSDDGTKFMYYSKGVLRVTNLNTPFDPSSASGYGASSLTVGNIYTRAFFDKTGKYIYAYFDDATAYSFNVITLPAPFDISSYSPTTIFSNTINPQNDIIGSTANNAYSRVIWSQDMRNITIIPYRGSAAAAIYQIPYYTKLNTPTLIDISTEGLSEVPSEVLLINNIKTNISTGVSTNKISCLDEPLWLSHSTATTSSAVVGHIDSGKISVGDTVTLNGTDDVVVTAVTETLNGLPYIGLDETDGNKYMNVAAVYGGRIDSADYYGYSPKMTFSPDGTKLFVLHSSVGTDDRNQGLTCYSMEIPWDISTLTEDPRGRISGPSYGFDSAYQGGYTTFGYNGIDFSPDGLRMFVFANANFYTFASQSELSVPWDPHSITSSTLFPTFYSTLASSSNNRMKDVKFTSDGTSVRFNQFISSTLSVNSVNRWYLNTSPWDLTGWPSGNHGAVNDLLYNSSRSETADGSTSGYRGIIERYNSDKSIIIYSGSGGTSDGFGTQSLRFVKDGNEYTILASGVALDNRPSVQTTDAYISPDGTKFYLLAITGNLYEYQIRAETLTRYDITFATQATVPTSVRIKNKKTALQLTPTVETINSTTADVTWSSDPVEVDVRAIQVQVEGAGVGTSISTIRLDLGTDI